jgi:hypothetical protein
MPTNAGTCTAGSPEAGEVDAAARGSVSAAEVVTSRPVMVVLTVDGISEEAGVPSAGDPALDHAFQTAADRGVELWVVAESDFVARRAGTVRSRNGRRLRAWLASDLRPWTRAFPQVSVQGYVTSGEISEVVLAWAPLTQLVVLDRPIHQHLRTEAAPSARDTGEVWVLPEPLHVTSSRLT